MVDINWMAIAALVASLGVAGALIFLYKRGAVQHNDLTNIGTMINSVVSMLKGMGKDDSVVSMFAEYAAKAVRVVEQLVKNGEIEKDNAIRKGIAHQTIVQLALADGVGLETIDENEGVIDVLIEAAVNEMQNSHMELVLNTEIVEPAGDSA